MASTGGSVWPFSQFRTGTGVTPRCSAAWRAVTRPAQLIYRTALHVTVKPVDYESLRARQPDGESSGQVAARVVEARARQQLRGSLNSPLHTPAPPDARAVRGAG